MSPDLEALSREIAATSDAWMVPGVSCVDPVTGIVFRANADLTLYPDSEAHSVLWGAWRDRLTDAEAYPDGLDERSVTAKRAMAVGPNLADPVTVNSLLGTGEARWDATKTYWVATIGKGDAACPTRTHAICRAWIAAHKGEGHV